MPQAPSPNMGLVLPDEGASLNVWAPLLDAAFGATGGGIDAHDHSPGKGVKVPSAGLNINANVSWVSNAATDLLAVDFAPTVAANVSAFSGALWLNSVDSNLYYRTTTGTNVQVTNGAALNVAGFVGGIGGDYSAVGALEVFDDGTDSYWFQQQLGGGVRQYARMRSADVDLYEYKANPTTGVPTQRVRLASPASLAASYALTFPGALPAAKSALYVDSSGLITVTASPSIQYAIGFVVPSAGTTFTGGSLPNLGLGTSVLSNILPLITVVGQSISSWSVSGVKNSSTGTISAKLWKTTLSNETFAQVGATQSNGAVSPGSITLGQSGLSEVVASGTVYSIEVIGGGSTTPTGDAIYGYSFAG